VLATTVSPETCTDAEILQAYQEQNTTVEPGFRWIKNPRGDRSRVAGEARTDCRLGDAHGAGLAGLQHYPETGPPLSARP
jgi:hypothetical protein